MAVEQATTHGRAARKADAMESTENMAAGTAGGDRGARLDVCVLFGGVSSEHDISLKSADTVLAALDPARYSVSMLGITRDGRWLRYRGAPEHVANGTWEQGPCSPAFVAPDRGVHGIVELAANGGVLQTHVDVAVPVLHGRGCGILASALGMDKASTYGIVREAGVRCPRCRTLTFAAGEPAGLGSRTAEVADVVDELGYPLFVKPANGGSSFGVSKVEGPEGLASAVEAARGYDAKVVFEEAIRGTEVGCAVMGPASAPDDGLVAGLPDQIRVASGLFRIHQEAKPGANAENSSIVCPAPLDAAAVARVQETGRRIYRALGCEGFARVDLFLTPEGELVFNEVNTFPGMTYYSRFPAMMRAAGHDVPEVLDCLIQLALERGPR